MLATTWPPWPSNTGTASRNDGRLASDALEFARRATSRQRGRAVSTPVEAAELVEESVGAVVVLRLNRPRRRNALTAELVDAVHHALLRAEQNPEVRSVVLTGNGGAFSAGADIKGDRLGAKVLLEEHYNPLITTMLTSDLPIVAALDGVAAGAARCGPDVVVAAPGGWRPSRRTCAAWIRSLGSRRSVMGSGDSSNGTRLRCGRRAGAGARAGCDEFECR